MSEEERSRRNKRSLDNLKEEHADVAAVNRAAKQGKIDATGNDGSNSKENDNDNDNDNKKNENDISMWKTWKVDIGAEDDDVPIDINKLLRIRAGDRKKGEVTVTGLKELAALKGRNNLPYTDKDLWTFHVVPQFPQTRVKDEEMQKYLRPPEWVPPPKHEFSDQEKKQLSEYMVDKNGDVTENNMDWEKLAYGGGVCMDLIKLIAQIPREPPKNECEVIVHKNANTVEGYECFGIDEFVPAFTNLLGKSKSFLEKDSEEAIKIYIFDYNDDEDDDTKYYHIINFIPK